MVSSNHPEGTRNTHPAFFGPGGGGWAAWGRWRADVVRWARWQVPGVRIKPCVHLRGGVLEGERMRLDAPHRAWHENALLGDRRAFREALAVVVAAAGEPAVLYEGAVDTGASAAEDPFEVWDDLNHDLASSGLVNAWVFDATSGTAAPVDPAAGDDPVPDPRVVRLFERVQRRWGASVLCEAWPLAHNGVLCRGRGRGVLVTSHDYVRSVQEPWNEADLSVRTERVRGQFLPRAAFDGVAVLACIAAGRDHIADAAAWVRLGVGNIAALDLQGLQAAKRTPAELVRLSRG